MLENFLSPIRRKTRDKYKNKEIFSDLLEKRELVEICNKIVDYIQVHEISDLVLIDRSARPVYIGVLILWRRKFPDLEPPNISFINPTGLIDINKGLAPGRFDIPRAVELQLLAEKYGESCVDIADLENWTARSVEEQFSDKYKGLMSRKDKPILLFDNCIHSGSSFYPTMNLFVRLGFRDIRFGVTSNSDNFSGTKPDLICLDRTPIGLCHPFHKDKLVKKPFGNVSTTPSDQESDIRFAEQKRLELARIFRNAPNEWFMDYTDSIAIHSRPMDQSTLNSKMDIRNSSGKTSEVLVLDFDGVIGINTLDGVIVGDESTRFMIEQKSIPVIINTARPDWTDYDDGITDEYYRFAKPDVVSFGAGTNILWRQNDGSMMIDTDYANKIRRHYVSVWNDEIEGDVVFPYDAELVLNAILPIITNNQFLVDAIIDNPEIEGAVSSIRITATKMPYKELGKLINRVKSATRGIKIVPSEHYSSNDQFFTGWLHIVPSIAGKERSTKYILREIAKKTNSQIQGHVVGDSTVDIPMLAMGSKPNDEFTLYQHVPSNAFPNAKRLLLGVYNSNNKLKQGAPRANLTFSEYTGPQLLNQIVSSIE